MLERLDQRGGQRAPRYTGDDILLPTSPPRFRALYPLLRVRGVEAAPSAAPSPVRAAGIGWEHRTMDMRHMEAAAPEISTIIRREERRQFEGIELIASE